MTKQSNVPSATKKIAQPKLLKCVVCNFEVACSEKFVQHVANDHETPEIKRKRMCCQLCDFTTNLFREMEVHETNGHLNINSDRSLIPLNKKQKMSDKETIQFSCKSCSFQSLHQMGVVQHFMQFNIDRNVVNNDISENAYINDVMMSNVTETDRSKKVKSSFKKVKLYRCRRCYFKTAFRKKFALHLSKNHPELFLEQGDSDNGDTMKSIDNVTVTNLNKSKRLETFDRGNLTSDIVKSESEIDNKPEIEDNSSDKENQNQEKLKSNPPTMVRSTLWR